MPLADKIIALMGALKPANVETLPPAERRRFADLCRHWAQIAEIADTADRSAGTADVGLARLSDHWSQPHDPSLRTAGVLPELARWGRSYES